MTHFALSCIYKAETNLKDMKLTRLTAIIGIALSCMLSTSCTCKKDPIPGSGCDMWTGTYPVQTLNNDTKEMEDHVGCISLQFQKSRSECIVDTGIVGLLATNRIRYEVKWFTKETFTLCETKGGQTIQYYSGTITGGRMKLEFLSCDKVERTVELERIYLE